MVEVHSLSHRGPRAKVYLSRVLGLHPRLSHVWMLESGSLVKLDLEFGDVLLSFHELDHDAFPDLALVRRNVVDQECRHLPP